MKLHHIYFLLLFTLLAGCSGQRGSVRLNITRSFVTANAGFSGGLYIHGKNASTGEEFSFALASQTSSSVQLKFGIWDIRVLGWENGAEYFEGNVLCGLEKIDFKSDNQSANIQITNPKCKDSAFTNLSFINETNGIVSFKPIPVYTCGALYDITDPTKLKSATGLTPDYCQMYPKAFQKKAKGMKIGLHNKLIGGSIEDGLTSNCISSSVTASNESFQNAKLLPTKIPITITFFEDNICSTTALAGKYHFPDGLEHTRSREQIGFDAVLSGGVVPMLAVASTLSKRGTTPFAKEIPTFNCGPTNFVSCLTLPPRGDADFVLGHGWNVVLLPPTPTITSCQDIQFASSAVSGVPHITLVNCIYENGRPKLFLNVNFNLTTPASTMGGTSTGGNSVISNGQTYVENLYSEGQYTFSVKDQVYNVRRFDQLWIYKDLNRILGKNESITADISNSLLDYGNEGGSNEGIFEELADILSPDKAGGLFWDQPCSSTPLSSPITRNVSIQEDGKTANYSLTLTNSPSGTLPTYTSAGSLYPILPSSIHRRIIIREFRDLIGYKTRMVLDLACAGLNMFDSARIGKLEKQSQVTEGVREFNHKSLIFWNSTSSDHARFEKYEMNIERELTSSVQKRYSSFTRGEKILETPVSGEASVPGIKISQLNHHFQYNDESVGFREYDIRGTKIKQTQHTGLHYNSSTPGEIFNKTMYAEEMERVRFGLNTTNDFLMTHPNGNYISYNSIASKIKASNGYASWIHSLSPAPRLISGDLSLGGSKAIVATIPDGEAQDFTIHFYSHINSLLSVPVTINNEIITNPNINDIKTSVLDSGDFIITISVNGTNADTFTHYYATMKTEDILTSISANTPLSIDFLPLFNPSAIGQLTLTNDSSKFWVASIGQSSNNSSQSTINYCGVTPPTPATATATATALTCQYLPYNFPTPPYGMQLSMTYLKNSDQVSLTLFENLNPDPTLGTKATNYLIKDGVISISSPVVEENVSGSSSSMNAIMLYMTDLNQYPVDFEVTVPYVRPIIPGFEMNLMSVNPLIMEQKVFTNKATFEGL